MNMMIFKNTKGQLNMEWVKAFSGMNQEVGKSIAYDGLGNSYIAGYFTGSTDFDPGINSLNVNVIGLQDIFVSKLDVNGNLVWVKTIGGLGNDIANAIALDSDGDIYITGFFRNTVDFDPGTGMNYLTSATTFSQDIFLLKLDSSGNHIWSKSFGGSGYYDSLNNLYDAVSNAYALAIDLSKNVYITGSFLGNIDFDPNIGIYNMASSSVSNIFVSKLNCGGDFVWAKRIGENKHGDEAYSITSDHVSNIYLSGVFADTCDFDPGVNNYSLISESLTSAFVLKLDSSGNFIWVNHYGGVTGNDQASAFSVHWNINHGITLSGNFKGSIQYVSLSGLTILNSLGANDVFIIKLSTSGNLIWAKSFGGLNNEYCYASTSDNLGNIYLTGSFKGNVDFDPGLNTAMLSSVNASNSDIYLSKLDALGNFIWAQRMGGYGNDLANSIKINQSGNIFLTGYFSGSAGFDPTINSVNLVSLGSVDAFILKYNQNTMMLPLSIKHFYGIPVNAGNLLKWETLNDLQTNYFEVQKSIDGIEFSRIGMVECLLYQEHQACYRYLDASAPSNIQYYRLKQIETDGQFSYSEIIKIIRSENEKSIDISPNPSNGKLKIKTSFNLQNGMIRVTNLNGHVMMMHKQIHGNLFYLDLSGWDNGIYFIQILQHNRDIYEYQIEQCCKIKIILSK
jgi:hypothetical protein